MSNYTVRIIKFTCVDESGIDFLGSDEPVWMFSANSNGTVNTTRSREFSDVDSGETFKFQTDNNRNIIWPKKAAIGGAPGPIGLSIQLWEKDQGDFDEIERNTQKALDLGSKVSGVPDWVKKVPSIVVDGIFKFVSDDLMGSKTLLFSEKRLRRILPTVGLKVRQTFRFGERGSDLPFGIAGSPDYDLVLEIARVS